LEDELSLPLSGWVDFDTATDNEMFVAEGGLRRNKLSNTSFLFGVSIRHNNPRKKQQPAFDMNITLGKFGTRGLETQTTTN
jgi:hypothetical protein